jgi:hypothetical protein
MSEYVQAWEINGPEFSGYVYDQRIALDKWTAAGPGAEMRSVTIVRHADGSREYLPGTVAAEVKRYREAV